ncbi:MULTISPECIES: GYD domain-containing protein [unclassified Blastococcus]
MPRFLYIANYAPQGAKAILSAGGTARRAAVEKMVTDLGGRLETFDFAFGSDDVYTIVELPDARTAAAVALTVNASGVAGVRTVVLMSPEEVDAVGQVEASYQPPTG